MIIAKDVRMLEHAQLLQQAVKTIIPGVAESVLTEENGTSIELAMGVIIGITGGFSGKLVLSGLESTFQEVSEMMYGMRLEGAMLESFAGEIGNMLGGHFSIELSKSNIPIDITAPTILQGSARISGFQTALRIQTLLMNGSQVEVYFLRD